MLMQLFTPKRPATFAYGGKTVRWRPGVLIEAGAPILKGREQLVRPIAIDHPAPAARKQQPAEKGSAG